MLLRKFLAVLPKVHLVYRMENASGRASSCRVPFCVINFSHTFMWTFSKLCTVMMDTLKIWKRKKSAVKICDHIK
jgi:hypothetical protein